MTEPEGGFAPESDENPYVEGVPLMAWVSGTLQASGVEQEDAVAGLCVEAVTIARGGSIDRAYMAFLVQRAVSCYSAQQAGGVSES